MAQRLPDRYFAGPSIRAALHLFRQPFIVWPGIVGTLGWAIFFLWAPTAEEPIALSEQLLVLAFTPVLGFGVAVLTGLQGFFLWRGLTAKPAPLALEPEEEELFSARANDFRGDENRGGRLHVTSRAVVFIPHRFNVTLEPIRIPLAEIESAAWAIVFGPSAAMMSRIAELRMHGGDVYTLVVSRAEHVAELVERESQRVRAV